IRDFHVTGVQTCALPICHPVSNFILNSSPKGSCSCQFGDHLSNGGSGHEFLRRKPVAGIAGAMVVDTHPSLRQYVDALDGIYRRDRKSVVRERGEMWVGA